MVTTHGGEGGANRRFTQEQAQQTRDLCATIKRVPGMVIAPFNWGTASTFWDGYMHGMDHDPFADFRLWGLQALGCPESNLGPFGVLRERHARAGEDDPPMWPGMSRERATEVATMMCDLVLAYVTAHDGSASSLPEQR